MAPEFAQPDTFLFGSGLIEGDQKDIYIALLDGTIISCITCDNDKYFDLSYSPAWFPDGRKYAYALYSSNPGVGNQIVVRDDGGHVFYAIRNESNDTYDDIEWSPDGKWLAFTYYKATSPFNPEVCYVEVRLWDPENAKLSCIAPEEWNRSPAWYPDSTRIIFSAGDLLNGQMDLYVWDTQSGEATPFTDTPGLNEYFPKWSPDGTQLGYVKVRLDDMTDPGALWIMSSDGASEEMIEGTMSILDFDWSPDGSKIIFSISVPPPPQDECQNIDGCVGSLALKIVDLETNVVSEIPDIYWGTDPSWRP